jgi:hypothetical protein
MPSLGGRNEMPIATGAMLLKDGTVLPEPEIKGASYLSGWMPSINDFGASSTGRGKSIVGH